jgi:hypothetical protein
MRLGAMTTDRAVEFVLASSFRCTRQRRPERGGGPAVVLSVTRRTVRAFLGLPRAAQHDNGPILGTATLRCQIVGRWLDFASDGREPLGVGRAWEDLIEDGRCRGPRFELEFFSSFSKQLRPVDPTNASVRPSHCQA